MRTRFGRWLLVCALLPAGSRADTLASIRQRHQLRWGMDAQGGAPYVFQSPMDPNLLVGFEVDLADAIAQRLGVRAVPVQGQWEQLLDLLNRGDFDIAMNGIEVADEKKRLCVLSKPYFAAAERLTVRSTGLRVGDGPAREAVLER